MIEPAANALANDADVLRAADAWQVESFPIWDAVKAQIAAAETPEPAPVSAEMLHRAQYETPAGSGGEPSGAAELAALVRDLQNEVSLLRREVETLKQAASDAAMHRRFVPKPPALPQTLRRSYPTPLFPLATPADLPR